MAAALFYDAGGMGVVLFGAAGLLRSVKNPTTTGIAMRINDKHIKPTPIKGWMAPLPNWPVNVPRPAADNAPNKHRKRPGHPHNTAAATVAIMPVVLLFITASSKILSICASILIKTGCRVLACIPFV